MPPIAWPKKSWRAWAEWVGRAMTDSSLRKPRMSSSSAPSLCEKEMDGRLARSDIEFGNVKQPFAPNGSAMRRPAQCVPDELLATGIGQ